MNKERLLKLVEFLNGLDPSEFQFSSTIDSVDEKNECGTVCCAMGWTPRVFPDLVEWAPYLLRSGALSSITPLLIKLKCGHEISHTYPDIAARIFDIPRADAVALFTPAYQHELITKYGMPIKNLGSDANPSDVASAIETYVNHKIS